MVAIRSIRHSPAARVLLILANALLCACSAGDTAADTVAGRAVRSGGAMTAVPDAASVPGTGDREMPVPETSSLVDIAELEGVWQVYRVDVRDAPVQALVADDPSLLGQRMQIKGGQIVWLTAGSHAVEGDACNDAATMRLTGNARNAVLATYGAALARLGLPGEPHEIACLGGGHWPEPDGGALLFASGFHRSLPPHVLDRIIMTWRDNSVLGLERQATDR